MQNANGRKVILAYQTHQYSRYRIYGPRWDQTKIDHISNMTIYQILLWKGVGRWGGRADKTEAGNLALINQIIRLIGC